MDENQFWALVYSSVLSIRLHPRNDGDRENPEIVEDALAFAEYAADVAVLVYKERVCPSHQA